MKDGFILYCSHYSAIKLLSMEEKGLLLDAIFLYHIDGKEIEMQSLPVKMAFAFLKQQFDRDTSKYQRIVERNKANGAKGGRPKKKNPENQVGNLGYSQKPRKADNDNGKDNDNDITPSIISLTGECEREKTEKKKFTIPTCNEVEAYCKERHNNISGSEFVDFYASKGWMVGKNKMKDWKASVRTWERKRGKENEAERPKYNIVTAPSEQPRS